METASSWIRKIFKNAGSFIFWILLPYLIAMFIRMARNSSETRTPMEFGRDITKAVKEVTLTEKEKNGAQKDNHL